MVASVLIQPEGRQTFMLQPSWFSFSSLGLDNKEFIGKENDYYGL